MLLLTQRAHHLPFRTISPGYSDPVRYRPKIPIPHEPCLPSVRDTGDYQGATT
jgi:hypothetical protein